MLRLSALALALLVGVALAAPKAPSPLPLNPPSVNFPKGYLATATWSAVTQDVNGQPLVNAVSYKVYNVKNGLVGYMGSTPTFTWKWTVNVNQCVFTTAVIYVGGAPVESAASSAICIGVTTPPP